jgi:hypothetical protein
MKTYVNTFSGKICAAVVLLVLAMSTAAFAVPANQVSRILTPITGGGPCCFFWNQMVTINEPAKLAPLVVTWSTDFRVLAFGPMNMGLSLNLGPCQFFGPSTLAQKVVDPHSANSRSFVWVVLPSDGLIPGLNRIDVCGGGVSSYQLGNRTLTVRISK